MEIPNKNITLYSCKKLFSKLLEISLKDFVKYYKKLEKLDKNSEEYDILRKELSELERWLNDREDYHIFSFKELCENLGFDPDYIKEETYKRLESHIS